MSTYAIRRLTLQVLLYTAISFIVLFTILPLVWIVMTSFKQDIDTFAYPPLFVFKPTLKNYTELFTEGLNSETQGSLLQAFRNSIVVTLVSTSISLAAACLAGYSLARLRPKGGNVLTVFILGVRMLPPSTIELSSANLDK